MPGWHPSRPSFLLWQVPLLMTELPRPPPLPPLLLHMMSKAVLKSQAGEVEGALAQIRYVREAIIRSLDPAQPFDPQTAIYLLRSMAAVYAQVCWLPNPRLPCHADRKP